MVDAAGHDRASLLAGVAVAFGSAGSREEVMQALVASLAPEMCDGCEVVLADPTGGLERIAAGPGAYAARRHAPLPANPDHPVRTVWATGETVLLRRDRPDEEHLFGPPDLPGTAANLGVETAILAPMTATERIVGVLVLALGPSGRDWQPGDEAFIGAIAQLAGLALENLSSKSEAAQARAELEQLLERQRHIARTLQESLLPQVLPEIPGAAVRAHYWPAAADLDVSGDFYDVFPLGGTRWGLLIGDVCGKGVEAAAATASARHTARAAALHLADPAVVLRWVHEGVKALELTFCTMAYAVFDDATGDLAVSLGGHPPGILVRSDGRAERVGEYGTLLGIIDPMLQTTRTTIRSGDLLVFFTDGITDAPRGGEMAADELVRLLQDQVGAPLDELGSLLHEALEARRPDGFADDIALLLLRRS